MNFTNILAAALLLAPVIRAESVVECDLLIVRLPEVEALPLITDLRAPKSAQLARETIINVITAKRGTLVDWPVIETPSGQRGVSEHIQEVRFASEYEAPGTAKIVEMTAKDSAPADPVKVTKAETITEGVPTEFDTRNTGVTLELEPTVAADGKSIQINLAVQHVEIAGFRKVEILQKESGKTVVVEQPDFNIKKVTTTVSIRDGDITLLHVAKLSQPKDQVELFILNTRLKRLPNGEAARFNPPKLDNPGGFPPAPQ